MGKLFNKTVIGIVVVLAFSFKVFAGLGGGVWFVSDVQKVHKYCEEKAIYEYKADYEPSELRNEFINRCERKVFLKAERHYLCNGMYITGFYLSQGKVYTSDNDEVVGIYKYSGSGVHQCEGLSVQGITFGDDGKVWLDVDKSVHGTYGDIGSVQTVNMNDRKLSYHKKELADIMKDGMKFLNEPYEGLVRVK